jgi:hypothetical protein
VVTSQGGRQEEASRSCWNGRWTDCADAERSMVTRPGRLSNTPIKHRRRQAGSFRTRTHSITQAVAKLLLRTTRKVRCGQLAPPEDRVLLSAFRNATATCKRRKRVESDGAAHASLWLTGATRPARQPVKTPVRRCSVTAVPSLSKSIKVRASRVPMPNVKVSDCSGKPRGASSPEPGRLSEGSSNGRSTRCLRALRGFPHSPGC